MADIKTPLPGQQQEQPQGQERRDESGRSWVTPVVLGTVLIVALVGALMLYNHVASKTDGAGTGGSTDTTATAKAKATPTPAKKTDEWPSGVAGLSVTATATVPDFTMTDANGNEVALSSLVGAPTVLNFWASWCVPCCDELPAFQKMYDQYGTQVNFVMLNVGGKGDTVAVVQKFYQDHGYTFPLYFDESGDGATLFGVTSIPETVFLNESGLNYGKVVGRMSQATLAKALRLITQQ